MHPQPETTGATSIRSASASCYDEGKRCAETLFFDYHRQHGLEIKVARIFNTYGPRMHPNDGRVVSNFIVQALRGEPITIYRRRQQTRSFCYVDDLIDGLMRLMDTPADFTGPVNLGNPAEFTDPRTGRASHRADRLASRSCLPAAAAGRSQAAPARHLARPRNLGMGTQGFALRGDERDH